MISKIREKVKVSLEPLIRLAFDDSVVVIDPDPIPSPAAVS
jgi:hypothetical protein